jgi:hypothetical protein
MELSLDGPPNLAGNTQGGEGEMAENGQRNELYRWRARHGREAPLVARLVRSMHEIPDRVRACWRSSNRRNSRYEDESGASVCAASGRKVMERRDAKPRDLARCQERGERGVDYSAGRSESSKSRVQ